METDKSSFFIPFFGLLSHQLTTVVLSQEQANSTRFKDEADRKEFNCFLKRNKRRQVPPQKEREGLIDSSCMWERGVLVSHRLPVGKLQQQASLQPAPIQSVDTVRLLFSASLSFAVSYLFQSPRRPHLVECAMRGRLTDCWQVGKSDF